MSTITIQFTPSDAIQFSVDVIGILNNKGFHVRSLGEALSCIEAITETTTEIEIIEAMNDGFISD